METETTFHLQSDLDQTAEERLKALVRQQTAIARLGQGALSELELSTLLDQAVAIVAQTLEAEYVKVLELLPDRQELLLRAGVGWKEGWVGQTRVGAGKDSQAGYTLLVNEPVIVEDLRSEVRFSGPPLLHEHNVRSGISVIIPGQSHPFGVLGVHTTKRRKFTEDDIHFLQSVASLLGAAIERKRAEEALRESQEYLAGMISSAMDAIITIDQNHRIILFNHAAELMFGCPASEALGQPLDRFLPERFRESHRKYVSEFGESKMTRRRMGSLGVVYGLRANGEEFPLEASISQVETNGKKLFTVILRDISERVQAEQRLRQQAALLDQAQDAILVSDLSNHILFWNKGAERIYGWTSEEVIGKEISSLLYRGHSPQFERATRTVIEKGEWVGELSQFTKTGKEIAAECHWTLVRDEAGQPTSILLINTDITERKKLEAQFLRAQRMESIGTLAGGIAHDLNNVLSPILMAVQMLQLKFTDQESQRWLQLLRTNGERGAAMVKQLLSFARGIEGERIALQPQHLIREIVKILRNTFPKTIEIQLRVPDDLGAIAGDATQLHQVLMNLCVNARDAMPHGGQLLIEADNVYLDENYARMNLDAKPGHYVMISVSDTGEGIAPEILPKIFDPFFTTKEQGKGTGLGLSTVMGIVKGHGGFVNVYSEVNKGTQFKVFLPAIVSAPSTAAAGEKPVLPVGHGELILIVDDEEAIREITKGSLEAFGYRVLTASDGTEAVALYVQYRDEIKVVVTDMVMPYMDGPATIRALQRINPQVKIIATSGLAGNGKIAEAASAGVKTFLNKPYTADKLLNALAEILTPCPEK
jgi:PAS domain S-box-containing protein